MNYVGEYELLSCLLMDLLGQCYYWSVKRDAWNWFGIGIGLIEILNLCIKYVVKLECVIGLCMEKSEIDLYELDCMESD